MRRRASWLWLLLLIPMTVGLVRLRLDVEVLNLLPKNEPVVEGLRLYQQHFSNARELLIAIEGTDADEVEIAAREIARQLRSDTNRVAHVAWQPPWMEKPADSAELIAYLWLNQPPEIFARLTNRFAGAGLTNALLESREALATSLSPDDIAFRGYDPLQLMKLPDELNGSRSVAGSGQDAFASADGTFRVLFVEATTPLASYRDCLRWLEAVQSHVHEAIRDTKSASSESAPRQIPLSPQRGEGSGVRGENAREHHTPIRVHYTGRPAFVAEIAGGMERDMFMSVGSTMVIIAALFWWAHRRWRPLLWLLVMLAVVLGGTMALGGLLIGELNVVSLGFAAILLGLAVDYGLVLYQEARSNPHANYHAVRRSIAPSIFWAAFTTSGAFLMLNLSGLPGMGQLGTLVALGVPLAAVVMLFLYLPPLMRFATTAQGEPDQPDPTSPGESSTWRAALVFTAVIVVVSLIINVARPPQFDHSGDALRPQNSPAYATLDLIQERMGHEQEPLWVIVQGDTEEAVSRSLSDLRNVLSEAESDGLIADFTLPETLWPHAAFQRANASTAAWLADQLLEVRAATLGLGFSTNALNLTQHITETWDQFANTEGVFWPTNDTSQWTLGKLAVRDDNKFFCAGLIYPIEGDRTASLGAFVDTWPDEFTRNGILLSGWSLLGESVFDIVMEDLPRVLIPMAALILVTLWLAYRRVAEILLSLAMLAVAALILSAVMALLGWRWNLMNLMAMPLLLGAGVDYTIHMQLALQRHAGNLREVRRSVGRALLVCGGTTTTAFGSLSFSSNAGLASLGQVCATGILVSTLIAVFLLPLWWQSATRSRRSE